jgi:uncharacterized protein with PQ loop repeat
MPLAFTIPLVLVSIGSFLMQARRIQQVGAAGVSRTTWLGLLVTVTLWGVYGVTISDWTITATNIPLVFVASAIVLAMVRDGAARRRDLWLTGGGALAAALLAVATVGPAPVGAAAATVTTARILPQLVTAVQGADVAGVSITTWLGNVANKVPWTIYCFGVADVWMGWGAAIAVVLSLAIVAVVVIRRRDGAPALTPEPVDG